MKVPQARWKIMGVSALVALVATFPPVNAQEPEVPVLDIASVQEDDPPVVEEETVDGDTPVDDGGADDQVTDDSSSLTDTAEEDLSVEEMSPAELSERRRALESERRSEARERSEEKVQDEYQRMNSLIDAAPINPFPSFYEVSRVDYPSISPPINPLPRRVDAG